MAVTIGSVMRHCRNYFERGYFDGEITIQNGAITFPALADGRYIAISGSAYNDGVYKIGTDTLTDEVFTGRVWLLSPPASFVALADEITAWDVKNPVGAYTSERFGNYSYTRAGDGAGGAATWQSAFASRLRDYQLLTSEVMV